jgi:ankyrin repeat protein
MRAVDEGHEDTVELLLRHGANSYIRSNSYYDSDASEDEMNEPNGETALDIAEQHGDTYIVRLIKNHQKKERLTRSIQSRHRGNLTRKKIKTQKAKQKLQATKLPLADDLLGTIMDNIDQKKYNPSVTDRMNLERAENRLATTRSMNDIEWEEILREHPELRL